MAVNARWPLVAVASQDRFYCTSYLRHTFEIIYELNVTHTFAVDAACICDIFPERPKTGDLGRSITMDTGGE